jgi:hypothetical protein
MEEVLRMEFLLMIKVSFVYQLHTTIHSFYSALSTSSGGGFDSSLLMYFLDSSTPAR